MVKQQQWAGGVVSIFMTTLDVGCEVLTLFLVVRLSACVFVGSLV